MLDSLIIKGADELTAMWESKLLRASNGTEMWPVILSIVAHKWPDGYIALLKATFPKEFSGQIFAPFICSTAKINHFGHIVADVILRDNEPKVRDYPIFVNEIHMRDRLRKLADWLKLADADRVAFFDAARAWCGADRRLDPTFDPQDPDAKRLVAH